jgi:hypothetical protein
MPKLKKTDLPKVVKLKDSLGPSFILLGLALGSGELIMWPYLTSQYGLGLIWGGLLGITLQFFLNTEIMRYTLAHGESVFVGWRRWGKAIPWWFVVSTTIPWALPGFSSAAASITSHLIPALPETATAIFLLLLTGVIISSGKTLYKTMETFQKTLIYLGVPFILLITFFVAKMTDWSALAAGLVGVGEGWNWFPPGIAIGAFLGAFAYSGAGGNLGLAQSYYIKEKGFGMGIHYPKIKALIAGKLENARIDGKLFTQSATNLGRWRKWWKLVVQEHLIVFFSLGLITILFLATLANATARGAAAEGISFVFYQADSLSNMTAPIFGTLFLITSGLFLFATQLGVLESATRITAENILLLKHEVTDEVNSSRAFYFILWLEIIVGIILLLLGFEEPRLLLTLGAILNAAAMMVAFPLILFLNRRRLPARIRPNLLRQTMLVLGFLFFAYFVFQTFTSAQWL